MQSPITFESRLDRFNDSPLWGLHFVVPSDIAQELIIGKDRRIMCKVNQGEFLHCSLMPNKGAFFVLLNQSFVKKNKLIVGDLITVDVMKDVSEYGIDVATEFLEVMEQDSLAFQYFKALTSGKKRSLLHLINIVKSSDTKIRKSIIIANHLTANLGRLDFRMLGHAFKENKHW